MNQIDAAWQATVGSIAAARRRHGDSGGDAVGVTVLTGFLGSGKTTVLRQLLAEPAGLHIAAVVNDIGPVNIDAAVIKGLQVASRAPGRIELTNGCACCALVDDLAETLEGLAVSQTSDAIVVEASGVADPATLALAVEGAAGCMLDGVVAVVDAQQLASQLNDPRIGPAVRRQIDVAHLVVLSKVDQVEGEEVAVLTERLGQLAPGRSRGTWPHRSPVAARRSVAWSNLSSRRGRAPLRGGDCSRGTNKAVAGGRRCPLVRIVASLAATGERVVREP